MNVAQPAALGTIWRRITSVKEVGIGLAMVALVVLFSLTSPYFFDLDNLVNVVRQVSLLGIIALGMTLVIVSGEIDLSVGSIYGASAILTGVLLQAKVPLVLAIGLGLASGALIGLVNGVLVTYARIPALIVTLGVMNAARGIALILSQGHVVNLSARTVTPEALQLLQFLGQGKILGIPVMSVVFLLLAVLVWLLYSKTILGFRMRAVGGSKHAARASGINERQVKVVAFVLLGLLSAVAGLLNISFLGNVQGTTGQGMELNSIAAVIIGGTSLAGGQGTVVGTIIGVLIMGVLNNGIILLGISPFWQMTIVGVVIVVAVAMDIWTRRGRQP